MVKKLITTLLTAAMLVTVVNPITAKAAVTNEVVQTLQNAFKNEKTYTVQKYSKFLENVDTVEFDMTLNSFDSTVAQIVTQDKVDVTCTYKVKDTTTYTNMITPSNIDQKVSGYVTKFEYENGAKTKDVHCKVELSQPTTVAVVVNGTVPDSEVVDNVKSCKIVKYKSGKSATFEVKTKSKKIDGVSLTVYKGEAVNDNIVDTKIVKTKKKTKVTLTTNKWRYGTYKVGVRVYKEIEGQKHYGKEYVYTFISDPKMNASAIQKTISQKGFTVKWSKVSGAKKYVVYFTDNPNGKWSKIGSTKKTSYKVKKNLTIGKTYYWYVQSVTKDDSGKTVKSPKVANTINLYYN